MGGKCPSCHKTFQVSEDEGMPDQCPNCGYGAEEETYECDGCGESIHKGAKMISWYDGRRNYYYLHDNKDCSYDFMCNIGTSMDA